MNKMNINELQPNLMEIVTGKKLDEKMCAKLLQAGTELIPMSEATGNKDDADKGWIIVPPKEYMVSKQKYDEWLKIVNDIVKESNA